MKRLSERIDIIKEMSEIKNLKVYLEDNVNYYVMIKEMQKNEIEKFVKLSKKIWCKKFKRSACKYRRI